MDSSLKRFPLPKSWPQSVKTAVLHVIALARVAIVHSRSLVVNSPNARMRLAGDLQGALNEISLLEEELRIKDERMRRIPPQKRPHYVSTERMSILEVRSARAWSISQTADAFLVTPATNAYWMNRLDDEGPDALVQIREPVNKFPDFIRYAVQRLKTLCPNLGRIKIAEILCRAGLHFGATTVRRILKEPPHPAPREAVASGDHRVSAKRVNHVWHIDLTAVPTIAGFWTPWLPFALPQRWPFCWWLAVIVDHFSRRAMGFAVFPKRPSSHAIRGFVGRIVRATATPKHLISDKDKIFWCDAFKRWCRRKGIRPGFGAAGQHGSIAIIERFIRTLKDEGVRRILGALSRADFAREVASFFDWYNEHRPHATLGGQAPNEVYFRLRAANRRPRIEPRRRWPRSAPCAQPRTLIAGQPGDRFTLEVGFLDSKRHLPIVSLRRAA